MYITHQENSCGFISPKIIEKCTLGEIYETFSFVFIPIWELWFLFKFDTSLMIIFNDNRPPKEVYPFRNDKKYIIYLVIDQICVDEK